MKKVILFLCFGFYGFSEEARLSFFVGDVFVKKKQGASFKKASLNMITEERDLIKTGEDSKAEIKKGENVIKIDSNTEFKVVFMSDKRDLFNVVCGKVWFRLKRLKGRDVCVETPTCVMGARGTIFSVSVFVSIFEEKETTVDLFKGELEVLAEGKNYILKDGEGLIHNPDKPENESIKSRKLNIQEIKKFEDIFELPSQAMSPISIQKEIGVKTQMKDMNNRIEEEKEREVKKEEKKIKKEKKVKKEEKEKKIKKEKKEKKVKKEGKERSKRIIVIVTVIMFIVMFLLLFVIIR